MSKRCLVFLFIIIGVSNSFAQIPVDYKKQLELNALSQTSRQNFSVRHQKALSLATANNWPVKRISQSGNILSLQTVNGRGFPVYLITHNNTIAAATTGTTAIQPGGSLNLNLTGSSSFLNNKLGIWDGGSVYAAHREFAGKTVTSKNNSAVANHSTHVAGTMIAKGVYAPAKGMAYRANTLLSWDFDDDVTEMSAAASGLLLSNHSYGDVGGWDYNSTSNRWEWYGLPGDTVDYNFGFYDSRVQAWDKIAYNAPYYLIVESAGNSRSSNGPAEGETYYGFTSRTNPTFIKKGPRPAGISSNNGYDIITTTGTAKNILTVGAVRPLPDGPANSQDIQISYFSSWGPTDDGRIKPDIVGDGENVVSTGSQNASSYVTLSGTSMAAPNITGSLYLLQEYYAQKHSGTFMRAATLKGLACHTAFDAGNTGPDYIYGWGLLDAKKAAQAITDNGNKSIISENNLVQGQTKTIEVIASGDGPLSVTISWTDPEGTPTQGTTINDRTPKLVNDLDLRISDGEQTYNPWVLTPDKPSAAATLGDNIRDNIEQVYIANAVPGKKYVITVSHKGTLRTGSQAYSLIATGTGGRVYCASAPKSTSDSKIVNFTLANINKTAGGGCTGYTDYTGIALQLEAGKTYPFSVLLGTCGANFNKAAKIFADWDGSGTFDENELVATTGVISANGVYSGNITVPGSVIPGNISRLRIVLNETEDPKSINACGGYAKGETQDYRIEFLKPAKDAGAIAIVNSDAGVICEASVAVTVRLKNFGTAPISNIPVTVTVTGPDKVITTFTETFTAELVPQEESDFTLNGKFNTTAGATYSVVATTGLSDDPISANNTATGNIVTGIPPQITNAAAYYCKNAGGYQLQATGDGTVLWYKDVNDAVPVAAGSTVLTTLQPVNNTFYAGLNDFGGKIGPQNKQVFTNGGYNQFTPGVKVNTQVPVNIESARLYIGNTGKITFTATNDNGEVVSAVTLDVTATRTAAAPGELPNDPADEGKVYSLNLLLPAAGNYTITPEYENGATIFRNNVGVEGYPFSIGDVFKITGNTAIPDQSETDTTYYKGFYYYFYDMKVSSPGCASTERMPVTVIKPAITQTGDMLTSSIANGNQWYLEGKVIAGATAASYQPIVSGSYTVQVALNDGCTAESDPFNYAMIAKNPDRSEIGLSVFPVPANDYLNVVFTAKTAAEVKLAIVNTAGQVMFQSTYKANAGNFSAAINTTDLQPGVYMLQINIGQKRYAKKVIVVK